VCVCVKINNFHYRKLLEIIDDEAFLFYFFAGNSGSCLLK